MDATGNGTSKQQTTLREYVDSLPERWDESLTALLVELTPGYSEERRAGVALAAIELLVASRTGRPIPLPNGGTMDVAALLARPGVDDDPSLRFSLLLGDRLGLVGGVGSLGPVA